MDQDTHRVEVVRDQRSEELLTDDQQAGVQQALGELATSGDGHLESEFHYVSEDMSIEERRRHFGVETDTELAHKLMETGNDTLLATNLSKLRHLDSSVAELLLSAGLLLSVVQNIESFDHFTNTQVQKLIGVGYGFELVNSYERLGLDGEHLIRLLACEEESAWMALDFLHIANGRLTQNDVAKLLIENNDPHTLAYQLYRCKQLDRDVALDLIANGYIDQVLQFPESFQETVRHELPGLAINNGRPDLVVAQLDKLKDLDMNRLAQSLIDNHYIDILRSYIDEFKDLNQSIARQLVHRGHLQFIAENLAAFGGIDHWWFVNTCIEGGEARYAMRERSYYPEITNEAIVNIFMNLGQISRLLEMAEEFPDLLPSISFECIMETEHAVELLTYMDLFPELDQQAFAFSLIDQGLGQDVIDAQGFFTPSDATTAIVERLFAAGLGESAIIDVGQWRGIDTSKIIHLALDHGFYEKIQYQLDMLHDLDITIAKRLIEYGDDTIECVARSLASFNQLDNEVLEALLRYVNGVPIENLWADRGDDIINYLYLFHDIEDGTINKLRESSGIDYVSAYPNNGSDWEKDTWFANHAFIYLQGGFSKRVVGRVIRRQVELKPRSGLHDASLWLEKFQVPETSYDIAEIMRNRERTDFDPDDYFRESLSSSEAEVTFFAKVLEAPHDLRQRLLLSSKEGAEQSLFALPEHQIMYRILVTPDENGVPYYQHDEIDIEELLNRALQASHEYREVAFGHDKDRASMRDEANILEGCLLDVINDEYIDRNPGTGSISGSLQHLKTLGQRRQAYIKGAEGWLLKHATSPTARLAKVWPDRARALMNPGVKDTAKSIEAWQRENAFSGLIQMKMREPNIDHIDYKSLLSDTTAPLRTELLRVLSAEETLQAMVKYDLWFRKFEYEGGAKRLPAEVIPITLDTVPVSQTKPFIFEVLAADDPRGFTIGEETGCCMTLNGVSESCIQTGYSSPDAGFMAMYAPSGDIAAQSFWYVNPDRPDTLVIDNIEANEGRDMKSVLSVYIDALQQYINDHPELGVTRVHIGTGYSDVNLTHLKQVDAVPMFDQDTYSDAHTQKLLYQKGNA